MSNTKRALSSTARRSDEAVKAKPSPPVDLWSQLQDDLESVYQTGVPSDPNAFTAQQFGAKLGITANQTYSRIDKLVRAGKVKKIGRVGMHFYYQRVDSKNGVIRSQK